MPIKVNYDRKGLTSINFILIIHAGTQILLGQTEKCKLQILKALMIFCNINSSVKYGVIVRIIESFESQDINNKMR